MFNIGEYIIEKKLKKVFHEICKGQKNFDNKTFIN